MGSFITILDGCALLQAEYGQRPVGLTLVDSRGELHGLLPLMATRGLPVLRSSGITGRRLSSLPRTPVAGPIADDPNGPCAVARGGS